jgi:hypothetical protein
VTNRQKLFLYAIHLFPMAAIAVLVSTREDMDGRDIFVVSLAFGLLPLAIRGLAGLFPAENFPRRRVVHLIEYALLRGILFGAVTSIYLAMAEPTLALPGLLERFAASAVLFGGFLLATDLYRRRKLTPGDRQ